MLRILSLLSISFKSSSNTLLPVNILDVKSQRLKQLTLDLIEASKVSTGNIEFEYINLDYTELIQQAVAEFEDKFTENSLEIVLAVPDEPAFIHVDGAQMGGQTVSSIQNLIQQGRINGKTPVWTAGMPNWTRLKDVPELNALLNNIVPPPMNL